MEGDYEYQSTGDPSNIYLPPLHLLCECHQGNKRERESTSKASERREWRGKNNLVKNVECSLSSHELLPCKLVNVWLLQVVNLDNTV
jgi:hypothetical protein